jgi:cytochrome c oxidase cbb3-type subunit III
MFLQPIRKVYKIKPTSLNKKIINMRLKNINKSIVFSIILLFVGGFSAIAQTVEATSAAPASGDSNYTTLRLCLAAVVLMLIWVISILSSTAKSASTNFIEKIKKERQNDSNTSKIISSIILLFIAQAGFAQTAEATSPAPSSMFTLSMPLDIYMMVLVILLEIVVIIYLQNSLNRFLGIHKIRKEKEAVTKKVSNKNSFFNRINQTVPIEEEHTLDLQHNYDGIRELDNNIPQWWKVAFYSTILFGAVYFYKFFIADTFPSQYTELANENKTAEVQKIAYLKDAANNVDENTVKMADAEGLKDGAAIFTKNCIACHGDKGQGNTVGPNLTDQYWIHKGSLKDIFYTVKYGWTEKGMKSWKTDLSPVQIANVASFIYSLKGTNPVGAKEPQGEVYTEGGTDSTSVKEPVVVKDSVISKK